MEPAIDRRSAAFLCGWDHGFLGWSRLVDDGCNDLPFDRNYSAGYAAGCYAAGLPPDAQGGGGDGG